MAIIKHSVSPGLCAAVLEDGSLEPVNAYGPQVIFAALLGSLLAIDTVDINNQGNVGHNVHQMVNISKQDQVANINHLNGCNSWNSIFDYRKGMFATRFYGKKMCVVTKIDNTLFPHLEGLQQKPVRRSVIYSHNIITRHSIFGPPTHLFKYNVNSVPIANIGMYGAHIEALCRGIPSYTSDVNQVDEYYACETNSIIDIGGISFCF
ncbi:gastrokine-1-like [Dendrobates tinctorius]|uniref:gastrokine-1-like n=1 Tax=Dendrobates tinctorius TaxID=92724 RepID=UPI003CC972DE